MPTWAGPRAVLQYERSKVESKVADPSRWDTLYLDARMGLGKCAAAIARENPVKIQEDHSQASARLPPCEGWCLGNINFLGPCRLDDFHCPMKCLITTQSL